MLAVTDEFSARLDNGLTNISSFLCIYVYVCVFSFRIPILQHDNVRLKSSVYVTDTTLNARLHDLNKEELQNLWKHMCNMCVVLTK